MSRAAGGPLRQLGRFAALLLVSFLALQIWFAVRIAAMNLLAPQSTAFQRSEAWRLWRERGHLSWQQHWIAADRLSPQLKRAVIASEDANFASHGGIEWDAVESAWHRNLRAEAKAERAESKAERADAAAEARRVPARLVGGSTITQQLAKNLFLSGERTLWRKGQEFALAEMLEALLSKRRILEIYLNSVEWGEGVFGADAAANRYFRTDAARLDTMQAARLAVMLPAPKSFEKRPASPYLAARAAVVAGRMAAVEPP